MISPLSAVWGGAPFIDYLEGNAKVYDGSFDYDIISNFSLFERTQPFSFLCTLDMDRLTTQQLVRAAVGGSAKGLTISLNTDTFFFGIYNTFPTNAMATSFVGSISLGRNTYIATYDGSSNALGVDLYKAGIAQAKTITYDTLTGPTGSTIDMLIGSFNSGAGSRFLNANIKQLEIINRVATPAEIADASAGGSFRSAGIAHNSGEYFLAIDTEKVDGQNLTTFADTPAYTITAVGGSTYVPYL